MKVAQNMISLALGSSSNNKIWFTSDTHYGHGRVIDHCKRPFSNSIEMDDWLVRNWNNHVKTDDIVFHLGDVSFLNPKDLPDFLNRLNGKIYLVLGNHDKTIRNNSHQAQDRFTAIADVLRVRIQDADARGGWQQVFLSHFAHRVWDKRHYGCWHFYGHSHGSLPDAGDLSMDVGVDAVANLFLNSRTPESYRPINYTELKSIMRSRNFAPIDHHKNSRDTY